MGIPLSIIESALYKARKGRIQLLEHMCAQLDKQQQGSTSAPCFESSAHIVLNAAGEVVTGWPSSSSTSSSSSSAIVTLNQGLKHNAPAAALVRFDV
jgi:hypothetical protein